MRSIIKTESVEIFILESVKYHSIKIYHHSTKKINKYNFDFYENTSMKMKVFVNSRYFLSHFVLNYH